MGGSEYTNIPCLIRERPVDTIPSSQTLSDLHTFLPILLSFQTVKLHSGPWVMILIDSLSTAYETACYVARKRGFHATCFVIHLGTRLTLGTEYASNPVLINSNLPADQLRISFELNAISYSAFVF